MFYPVCFRDDARFSYTSIELSGILSSQLGTFALAYPHAAQANIFPKIIVYGKKKFV